MKFRNQFMKYYVHANDAGDGGGGGAGSSGEDAGDDLGGGGGASGGSAGDGGASAAAAGGAGDGGAGAWPDDWQSRVSKGDEKNAKLAGRFASPEALFDAYVAANNRIRSGELKAALPDNAKPEELAAWRKDNGIPEKAADYDLKFESGLVIGDEDRPAIDSFLETAHALNMTPDNVKAVIEWNEANKEAQIAARQELDETQRTSALDSLNVEWGGNFRRNVNMVSGLMDMMPESVRDSLSSARLPDGTAIFNNPDVLRGFAAIAHELNPAGAVVPAAGGDPMKGVNEEISQIEASMKADRKAYNKDEAKQARYRELLEAREKMKDRA
jgi:hypothetical protein